MSGNLKPGMSSLVEQYSSMRAYLALLTQGLVHHLVHSLIASSAAAPLFGGQWGSVIYDIRRLIPAVCYIFNTERLSDSSSSSSRLRCTVPPNFPMYSLQPNRFKSSQYRIAVIVPNGHAAPPASWSCNHIA